LILKLLAAIGQVVGVGLDVAIFVDGKLEERRARKRAKSLPYERGRRIQSERYREASNKAGKP
jgi:hypothetical protein